MDDIVAVPFEEGSAIDTVLLKVKLGVVFKV
jgi:hypothetical protein